MVATSLFMITADPTVPPKLSVVPQVESIVVETIEDTPITIKDKVYAAAAKYKVSGDQMWKVVSTCENKQLDPKKQSEHYYKGVREQSYGLVQIHLPSHPDITYDQATDVDWSLNWMAKEFSKGNQWMWSCYTKIYGGRT